METLLPFLWSFALLDRTTVETCVGVGLETVVTSGISDYDGGSPRIYSNRFDLFGELPLDKGRRWGLVASLPLTFIHVSYDDDELSYSEPGLGALSLGGYHHVDLGNTSLRARFDLVLPTDDFQGDRDPNLIREVAELHRISEPTDDRGSTWLRAAGVARYQRGPWLLQGEVFVKVSLADPLEYYFFYSDTQVPIGGLGLGLGRELGPLHATAEMSVAEIPLTDAEKLSGWDAFTKETMATAIVSLGGRLQAAQWRVHAGVPLHSHLVNHTVILGVDLQQRF